MQCKLRIHYRKFGLNVADLIVLFGVESCEQPRSKCAFLILKN